MMAWGRRGLWTAAAISSVVLLALVVSQVDWNAAVSMVDSIRYRWIIVGLGLQMIEGAVTAARCRLMCRRRVAYRDCLAATAWYVLMLIALPARLGEVAGVAAIVRHTGEKAGSAAAGLLFQRLFDVIFLMAVLGALGVFAFADSGAAPVVAIALIILVLVAGIASFEHLLAMIIRPLLARRRAKWPRRVMRIALQARMVRRHHLNGERTVKLALQTLLKWLVTLGAVAAVVYAVAPAVPPLSALGIGLVYNLSAIIPLQTIGGFGISEAALLASFNWLGYPVGLAAPIALAIRLALITGPVLFWAAVLSSRHVAPAAKPGGQGHRS